MLTQTEGKLIDMLCHRGAEEESIMVTFLLIPKEEQQQQMILFLQNNPEATVDEVIDEALELTEDEDE